MATAPYIPTTPGQLVDVIKKQPKKPETPEQRKARQRIQRGGGKVKTTPKPIEQPIKVKEPTREETLKALAIQRMKTAYLYNVYRQRQQSLIGRIDPTETYYIPEYYQPKGTPGYTPAHRVVSGAQLKQELEKDLTGTTRTYIEYRQQSKNVVKELITTRKPWGEPYLIATAKFPSPTGRAQLQAGYGAVTSIMATGAAIGKLTGIWRPKEYIPSPLDVAFNRDEYGRLIKKYPGILVGGVIGEYAQLKAIGWAGKQIKAGAITGTKYFVKKTPSVYSKFTLKYGLPGPAQKIIYDPKFQKFWQRLYSYSTGEMGYLKTFPMVKGYPKEMKIGHDYYKVTKFKGLGRRELVPKNVIQIAESKMIPTGKMYFSYTPAFTPRYELGITYKNIIVKGTFRKSVYDLFYSKTIKTGTIPAAGAAPTHAYKFSHRTLLSVPAQITTPDKVIKKNFLRFIYESSGTYQPVTRTVYKGVHTISPHHIGFLGKQPTISIPAQYVGTIPKIKIGYLPAQISLGALETGTKSIKLPMIKSLQLPLQQQINIMGLIRISAKDTVQGQKLKFKQLRIPATTPKVVTIPTATHAHTTTGPKKIPIPKIPKEAFILSEFKMGKLPGALSTRYLFREFKLPSIANILKEVKI